MIRLDTQGRDVSHLPGLWSSGNCEIVATNYAHPSITEGQHTNGPATIWIRLIGVEWYCTGETHLHKVRDQWVDGVAYGNKLIQGERRAT